MKRSLRLICFILVFSFIFAIPAYAETTVEPRGSAFFAAYGTDLEKICTGMFKIWFDVDANASTMQELGVSEIIVYRSSDQTNWTEMKTYNMEDYSSMIGYNTGTHDGYVTYALATSGYYYRAYITFYAKNSSGTAKRFVYTEILHM